MILKLYIIVADILKMCTCLFNKEISFLTKLRPVLFGLWLIQDDKFVNQLLPVSSRQIFLFIGCHNPVMQKSSGTAISSKEIPHLT